MPGTYPTDPEFRSINFDSTFGMMSDPSHSGRRFDRLIGGQHWMFSLEYNDSLTRAQYEKIFAFIQKQNNGFFDFTIRLPDKNTPRGIPSGTPLVNGAGQVGSAIITDGWAVSTNNLLLEGDIIKFNGHSKVYMVVDPVNSNGSGQATINISPALINSIADNETIVTSNVPFKVKLNSTSIAYGGRPGGFYSMDISVKEFY